MTTIEQIIQQWPLERKYKSACRLSWVYRRALERAIYERFGEEAIKTLAAVYSGMAEGIVDGMKRFGIEGNDARSFAHYWKAVDEIMFDTPIEIVEASPQKAVVRMPKCPSPVETNPRICSAHFAFEKRSVEILNPKLEVEMSKRISQGDPYCEGIIVLRA